MKNTITPTVKATFCLLLSTSLFAIVPEPASNKTVPMAFVGATAHLGNGQVINNALLAIRDGKITEIKTNDQTVDLSNYQVVDISGKQIYPGLILTNSELGLIEVDALKATHDEEEMGDINPSVRSIIAYNTDSELIPTLRFNGVLLSQTVPQGGIVSGRSSVVELDGWNWEDASYLADEGMHINWPSHWRRKFNFSTFNVDRVKNDDFDQAMQSIQKLFEDAKAYQQIQPAHRNLKLAAMAGLFDHKMKLYIHTDSAADIVSSVKFAQSLGVDNVTIVGGAESLDVTDFMVNNHVSVILSTIHRLPGTAEEPASLPFELPAKLVKAGVTVALGFESNMSARNLPFLAGTAAAYGLDKEQALSLITLNPAKILGISNTVGSLEKGKDATFFVSKGDALDMRGNQLSLAFIRGKKIGLEGTQQKLYERYHKKITE